MSSSFPLYRQLDSSDCGPTCLRMVCRFFGVCYDIQYLRRITKKDDDGVSLKLLSNAANELHLDNVIARTNVSHLINEHVLPAILFWDTNHYVVLYRINKEKKGTFFYIADPKFGRLKLSEPVFSQHWLDLKSGEGTLLLLEPREDFLDFGKAVSARESKVTKSYIHGVITSHIKTHYVKYGLLILITLAISLLNLCIPILTQYLVDKGIHKKALDIIVQVLFAQVFIVIGATLFDLLKNKLFLTVSSVLNLNILFSFVGKLTRLPLGYFEGKKVADISQRFLDLSRLEKLLTTNTISLVFSIFNFIFFSILILRYNLLIYVIFVFMSILGILWQLYHLRFRKHLDYEHYDATINNSNSIMELITGMKEICFNDAIDHKIEMQKKEQVKLHTIKKKSFSIDFTEQIGQVVIAQLKNAMVTFFAAYLVIQNRLTLGEMFSLSYMIGQLNTPFNQFFDFSKNFQDAFFSIERISDINTMATAYEQLQKEKTVVLNGATAVTQGSIHIRDLSFNYKAAQGRLALNQLNMEIPLGKKVAFVGKSGSGKTTLLKILLQVYEAQNGSIDINGLSFNQINRSSWLSKCGVVMQDGYIFSGSIRSNIVLNDEKFDTNRFAEACRLANIHEFIQELPFGAETKIGGLSTGISGGQKQRILIARALYKNPQVIFFDEATSALDTENESVIMENIFNYSDNRSLIVIAHRLSTVKNADIIFVFMDGTVVEKGNHQELIAAGGTYARLVASQLTDQATSIC